MLRRQEFDATSRTTSIAAVDGCDGSQAGTAQELMARVARAVPTMDAAASAKRGDPFHAKRAFCETFSPAGTPSRFLSRQMRARTHLNAAKVGCAWAPHPRTGHPRGEGRVRVRPLAAAFSSLWPAFAEVGALERIAGYPS